MPEHAGPVAIITGATIVPDGGLNIGGATATELVARGFRVVVADINVSGAADLTDKLNSESAGTVALAVTTDVRSESEIVRLVGDTLGRFGRLDVVINNAGIFPGGDGAVADLEVDVWDDVMNVNVRSAMLLTKHSLPEMLRAGSGAIVNTASTHSFAGDLRLTGYGASKAALIALTMYTATQYGSRGIRCNAICPGTTSSPPAARMPETVRNTYRRHTLNPRLNRPEDLARAFAFLSSDEAIGINGAILRVDGGLLAHQPFTPDFSDMAE